MNTPEIHTGSLENVVGVDMGDLTGMHILEAELVGCHKGGAGKKKGGSRIMTRITS